MFRSKILLVKTWRVQLYEIRQRKVQQPIKEDPQRAHRRSHSSSCSFICFITIVTYKIAHLSFFASTFTDLTSYSSSVENGGVCQFKQKQLNAKLIKTNCIFAKFPTVSYLIVQLFRKNELYKPKKNTVLIPVKFSFYGLKAELWC